MLMKRWSWSRPPFFLPARGLLRMQKFVIQQNIQHFQDLLESAIAPEDRQRLEALLAEERAKLRDIEDAEAGGA